MNAAVLDVNDMKDRRIMMLLIALTLRTLLTIMMTHQSYCCHYSIFLCTLQLFVVEQDPAQIMLLHFSLLIPSLKPKLQILLLRFVSLVLRA